MFLLLISILGKFVLIYLSQQKESVLLKANFLCLYVCKTEKIPYVGVASF